ncbi:MAG: DNA-3-methyladenine glycosylase I [bacterium]|nr:DNA-3-methyladenine glycosylase I [bacterium]
MPESTNRCDWAGQDQLYVKYHDEEWGVPVHDDRLLFEFLILEGAQAGLAWITILRKREHYRKVFANFDPAVIALYDETRVEELLQDPGIVRNRLKVNAAIKNANAFLEVVREFGSFDAFIWSFVDGKTIRNSFVRLDELPAQTEESIVMSKALKKRGFTFVGPTICYAFMQAVGMVNDHLTSCFRYKQV